LGDGFDAPGVEDFDAEAGGFVEEGVQHGVGVVGCGEHFAGGFLLEVHAQVGKEVDGVAGGEAFEG